MVITYECAIIRGIIRKIKNVFIYDGGPRTKQKL